MAESKGQWLDTKTGKVVSSQPEESVQLVAPGSEPTPADLARVEALKSATGGDKKDPAPAPTPAPAPGPAKRTSK